MQAKRMWMWKMEGNWPQDMWIDTPKDKSTKRWMRVRERQMWRPYVSVGVRTPEVARYVNMLVCLSFFFFLVSVVCDEVW